MTKLQVKFNRITSFGGIFLVNRLFDHLSLGKVINETLGLRSTAHNGYQWDEIVKSLFNIYLCGGDHIEDIISLMPSLSQAPGSHVPSSDTIGRGIKQLTTDNRQYHIYGQEWKYIHVQHQRVSERPTDETQHGRGAFQEWSVSGCGLWPSVHSHGETRCHILLQESVWLFPRCGKRGRCNRPCREPRRQYAGKVLSGRNLETAVSVPAQAWAVHLPISCRLRLLFERNRGNTRTTICSICVRQTAKVSIRNLQNWMVGKPLKSISRNARCAASSSTGS